MPGRDRSKSRGRQRGGKNTPMRGGRTAQSQHRPTSVAIEPSVKPKPLATKPKPPHLRDAISSNSETPTLPPSDDMIFVYENQPANEQERPDLKRNRTTPNETEPTKRLKSNNTPKAKPNQGHKQPVSQFNTPNVAYNRSNRFAQENLPKLTPKTTKSGAQIQKKATQSYYYDDNGKRFKFKCEKTHIKNLEGVTRTYAAKAETNAPSIKVIKGFQIETGKYKYDATIESDISSELANYIRNMHTRNGVTKQDAIDQLYKFGFIHCSCSDIDADLTYTNCECSGHYKIQCRPTHQMRCLESGQYEPDLNIFAKEDSRYWDNKTRYVKDNQKKKLS